MGRFLSLKGIFLGVLYRKLSHQLYIIMYTDIKCLDEVDDSFEYMVQVWRCNHQKCIQLLYLSPNDELLGDK